MGSPSPIRGALSLLLFLYVSVRRYLSSVWIKVNRWIVEPDRLLRTPRSRRRQATNDAHTPSVPPPFHKIVVIGDSFAMGIGDMGVLAGGSAGVAPMVLGYAAVDKSMKRKWKSGNRGELGATTEMWLPPLHPVDSPYEEASVTNGKHHVEKPKKFKASSKDGLISSKMLKGGVLYEQTFGKGAAFEDAEVVIVMMGTDDVLAGIDGMPLAAMKRDPCTPYPSEELATVVVNIREIARRLQSDGRRVCVVDMPSSGVPNAGAGKMRRLNRQIKQVVTKDPVLSGKGDKSGDASGLYPVQYVSLGTNHMIMRSDFRAFDCLHLNRKGYKILARDIFDVVKPMMINVEWEVWKPKLHAPCDQEEKRTEPEKRD